MCYAPATLTQIRFNVPFLYIVGEREVIASCVCDCARLLLCSSYLHFQTHSIHFFRGRISALASTLNTFFLLLNLNEFQRFFARERESKFQLEGERETMPQCEWRGNISYFAVDSLQFISSLNSSVSPEQIKHRWRCLYDHAKGKLMTWLETKLIFRFKQKKL